ncbi:MAG: PHP domain-containing protein [Promethearchaeota archaeon]
MNLHIHSNYSDGKNTIKQIVMKSIKLELDYIAITDHFTNSWKSWVSTLNNYDTITNYLGDISICQKYLTTYDKNLTLLKGLEVDISSSEQFIMKYIQINEFNLILFEYLQSYESIAFIKNIINRWKKTKINFTNFPILGLAHFDPSYFIVENLETLMKFLKEYNIYFEFNPSYASFYSPKYERFFNMLEEYQIPVGIGCDSHNLKNLNNIVEPLEMIKYYNLESNFEILISNLKIYKNS